MITKRDLQSLANIGERIRSIEEQIQTLRDQIRRCTPQLTGMPGGSRQEDRMAAYVAKAEKLLNLYRELVLELAEKKLKIERELDTLPEQQARVMRFRYIEGMSWRKVARKMHLSEDHCKHIHKKAIVRLEKSGEEKNEKGGSDQGNG